jgi:RimJ/RimL family protein N-acetyltransferase
MDGAIPEVPDELESERLQLRVPGESDAEAMVEAIAESFDELHRWMDWASAVPTRAEERVILARRAEAHRAGDELSYLMWSRDGRRLVGACGLPRPRWALRAFEIGYWVRTSLVGQGYVTEAVQRLTRLGFGELGARRIEIRTSARNQRSAAVAARAGYRLEHTRIGADRDPDGSIRDTLVFALYAPGARTDGSAALRGRP